MFKPMHTTKWFALFIVATLFTVAAPGKDASFGMILFPAKDNINFDEGTFELWFCLNYSFEQDMLKGGSSISPMSFFKILDPTGNKLAAETESSSKKSSKSKNSRSSSSSSDNVIEGVPLGASMSQHRNSHLFRYGSLAFGVKRKVWNGEKFVHVISGGGLSAPSKKLGWKKGEWHYMALTWKKLDDGGYLASLTFDDGKTQKQSFLPNPKVKEENAYDNIIAVGSTQQAWGSINCFRISNKIRTAEEMKESYANGLKKDDATLLLQDGSSIKSLKSLSSAKLGENPLRLRDGVVCGNLKLIDGKFGKAVSLSN